MHSVKELYLMKFIRKHLLWLTITACLQVSTFAQSNWPIEFPLETSGRILLYQLQPEVMNGNQLSARAAVSIRRNAEDEPLFGAIWLRSNLITDKDTRLTTLENIQITEAKFSAEEDPAQANILLQLLRQEIPKRRLNLALDELVATLDSEKNIYRDSFKNDPPDIQYAQQPTTLVLIDGEPFIKWDEQLAVNRVINTPFLLVQSPDDQLYYLYADGFWYHSSAIRFGWERISRLKGKIRKINRVVKKQEKAHPSPYYGYDDPVPSPRSIIVSTTPAELIQTEGEPQFTPIANTKLLYITNTDDNIFLDITSQQFYVVLAGRWYTSSHLRGPWQYLAADALPADFASIPASFEKQEVLTYIPGTVAAREALMDAQIPQTAKVDRRRAECTVTYDGQPQFEPIAGTNLFLAVNTASTVIRTNNRYYCVENGVWFMANQALGPWAVSTERPSEIERIPPGSPAYPVRYVYIYDITPNYVYMGYTAGYLGGYVYGPTIVYGTGYHYSSWYGNVYYPRPVTWGFNMHYDPWTGWNFGFGVGWFNFFSLRPHYWGWWGPSLYRPFYYRESYSSNWRRKVSPAISRGGATNNLYRYRNYAITRDAVRSNRTTTVPRTSRTPRTPTRPNVRTVPRNTPRQLTNDIYTDRSGNPFQRDRLGNWLRLEGRGWKPASPSTNPSLPQVQREYNLRERANNRVNTFRSQQQKVPTRSNKTVPQPRPRGNN